MSYCFLISADDKFRAAFKKMIETESKLCPIEIDTANKWSHGTPGSLENIELFNIICDTIEKNIDSNKSILQKSVAVVDDVVTWSKLDPLSTSANQGPEKLYAILLLTYPELRFVFLNDTDYQNQAHFHEWLTRSTLFEQHNDSTLFDPNGIRNKIRENINRNAKTASAQHRLSERTLQALSMDEEPAYAILHGYIAYKMGYRCQVVTSKLHLDTIKESGVKQFDLQFEDQFLNFPDKGELGLSDLRARDEKYPFLQAATNRFFITTGHGNFKQASDNEVYKTELNGHGKNVKTLYKPSSGIYDLIELSGLEFRYNADRLNQLNTFVPDNSETEATQQYLNSDHSAPGILLIIAERLIERAQILVDNARNVSDAIHAALLALEAKELLGCRTPTMALAAVTIQHKAEIIAECLFFGVEQNIKTKERFKEIKTEVCAISRFFKKDKAKQQELNARLTIANILAGTFNNFRRFEEELLSLSEARKLRFAFRRRKKLSWTKSFNWLTWLIHKHIEWSLSSTTNFFAIICGWVFVFTTFYFWLLGQSGVTHLLDSLVAAARFFFTLTMSKDWSDIFDAKGNWASVLLTFQGIVSFFNLSLLLSHLYLVVSRR